MEELKLVLLVLKLIVDVCRLIKRMEIDVIFRIGRFYKLNGRGYGF